MSHAALIGRGYAFVNEGTSPHASTIEKLEAELQ
jgi:hypothetical protein